ncbi:hypothetical protein BH11ARM1_BH11ARM1_18090 [soil metagenome]
MKTLKLCLLIVGLSVATLLLYPNLFKGSRSYTPGQTCLRKLHGLARAQLEYSADDTGQRFLE